VLCLGYLYHTYRHTELMYRLHGLAPKHLIVDTMVVPGSEAIHRMIGEPNAQDIRSAAPDDWSVGRVLVLRPSEPAVQMLMHAYGFEVESTYDWVGRLAGRPAMAGLAGYAKGERVTVRCRFRPEIIASSWQPIAGRTARRPSPSQPAAADPAVPEQPAGGWRDRVNRVLARTTGYELNRATPRR
jgi:hypothetical protein